MTRDADPATRPWRTGRGWWATAAILGFVLLVCIGIVFSGVLHDTDGSPLVDNPGAVLLGFFSLVGVLGSSAIAKLAPVLSNIKENIQNGHRKLDGTPLYLRDDLDEKHVAVGNRLTAVESHLDELTLQLGEAVDRVDHALSANRKTGDDVTQLREDVQAGRTETGEVRADVRGLRKDLGWIRDFITKGTTP